MAYAHSQLYDDEKAFETYWRCRRDPHNANDTLEEPSFSGLLGSVKGLEFLDLGCGDASFGKKLLAEGAASYLGVDGSANMIASAQGMLAGTGGQAVRADLTDWTCPADAFDRVTARLVLHYLSDLRPIVALVHRALRRGGLFVFSVEHPIITSCDRPQGDVMLHHEWIVNDYFRTGQRVTHWMGTQVVKHHRTVEDHFAALASAGFAVEGLREARPDRANFRDDETFVQREGIPLFLLMAARKPPEPAGKNSGEATPG